MSGWACCGGALTSAAATTVAVAVAAAVGGAAGGVIPLDSGWRFHRGSPVPEKLSCEPGATNAFDGPDLGGWDCPGWPRLGFGDGWATEEACAMYCCAEPSCAGYLYNNTPPDSCGDHTCTPTCRIGASLAGCTARAAPRSWVGRDRRTVPAAVPEPGPGGPHTTGFDDSGWRRLTVPHDYVIEGNPTPDGDYSHGYRPKPVGWYRRRFVLNRSLAGHAVWVEFDGVFRGATVWLNGRLLGQHSSGYTGFRFRLDSAGLRLGGPEAQNVLAVRVDPRGNEGWWYEGGGIYRHVRLLWAAGLHTVPLGGVFVHAAVPGPVDRGDLTADATATIETTLENAGPGVAAAAHGAVRSTVLDPGGRTVWSGVSDTVRVPANGTGTVVQHAALPGAAVWDGAAAPRLYTLRTEVLEAPAAAAGPPELLTASTVDTPFGVRKVVFDPDRGLLLNDRVVPVHGTANHHDYGGVGTAVPDRVTRYRVETLQEWGANGWRMSHNPPAPELLDATDARGMLVWDELRHFGNFSLWHAEARDTVLRDRNHPSVLWWSLCNEWGCAPSYDAAVTLGTAADFRAIVRGLDPSRPVTAAWVWPDIPEVDNVTEAWAADVVDVFGLNYHHELYDGFHAAHPGLPMIGSETCWGSTDRTTVPDPAAGVIAQTLVWPMISGCRAGLVNRSFVMGSFIWTGFDYRGEESPTKWPTTNSHYGMLDLCGFPKDDAHFAALAWDSDRRADHIVVVDDDGGSGGGGGPANVSVTVYTSGDSVELTVTGPAPRRFPRQPVPPLGRGLFAVSGAALTPGATLQSVSYRGEAVWAEQRHVVAGPAVAVALTVLRPREGDAALVADGQDVALLTASVLDAAGTVARAASSVLTFTVVRGDATVAGTCNGNPSDEWNATGPVRRVFSGLARAVVRMGTSPGPIEVAAAAPGLTPATVSLVSRPAVDPPEL